MVSNFFRGTAIFKFLLKWVGLDFGQFFTQLSGHTASSHRTRNNISSWKSMEIFRILDIYGSKICKKQQNETKNPQKGSSMRDQGRGGEFELAYSGSGLMEY
jgi:hypothetical protein